MSVSELRLIKHCMEFVEKKYVSKVPSKTRGIYVLLKYRPRLVSYDVVYIGMVGGVNAGIRVGCIHIDARKLTCGHILPFSKFGTTSVRKKSRSWRAFSATSTVKTLVQID